MYSDQYVISEDDYPVFDEISSPRPCFCDICTAKRQKNSEIPQTSPQKSVSGITAQNSAINSTMNLAQKNVRDTSTCMIFPEDVLIMLIIITFIVFVCCFMMKIGQMQQEIDLLKQFLAK